ncbi:MAG: pyridoxamine 5'-phosphate oxidase family protein, partial [Eubacterium sp.]|nr:pyridoxamine 5'-phosphate oxidase family protein [Eubacterium sp.]
MNRKDREVTDFNEIISIIDSCDTLRLGINNGEYPYVVPLSFGYEVQDNKIIFYTHCAKRGLKLDLIAENPMVCVETDAMNGYVETARGVTTNYRSFIGFGTAEIADYDDTVKGLDLLLKHCNVEGYSAEEWA